MKILEIPAALWKGANGLRECFRRGSKKPRDCLIHIKVYLLILAMFIASLALTTEDIAQAAQSWGYKITTSDTPATIDTANASAVVDTANNEIKLPKYAPHTAAMWGSDYLDYVVLTPTKLIHYAFNGSTMSEVSSLDVAGLSNPLAAATSSFPDAVVATATGVTHYSFNGFGMIPNPALSVSGLTNVVSVGTRNGSDIGVLANGQAKYFGFTGSSMTEIPALEINTGLSNPLDCALFRDSYDCVVLEQDKIRYFSSNGGSMVENPALAITGVTAPKAVAVGDGKDVIVISGNQAKHYSYAGSSFTYNAALSVTSGLVSPTCVATRPGTYDRLIVDGDQVRYYMWNGSQLVYNPSLSVTVAGLQNMGAYAASAVAQSNSYTTAAPVSHVRVRAYHVLPDGTSVTWAVTANGSSWTTVWRVRAAGGITYCDVTTDNGTSWQNIGDASQASPTMNNMQLWAQVPSGSSVKWRATLATTNTDVTPLIKAPNPGVGDAVVLETDNAPLPPAIPTPGTCYTTTTPTFSWTFSDPDPGDYQEAYQLLIRKQSDNSPVWDSGVVHSSETSLTVPQGVFWGTGEYQFTVQLQVFDSQMLASGYGAASEFCITAIENPQVTELASPSAPQTLPVVIVPGMTADQLPRTKAGGKVGVTVDTIGPFSSLTAQFPYLSTTATVGTPPAVQTAIGSYNKRWLTEFWTAADLDTCPSGTLVEAQFSGSGASLNLPPYAEGIVVTDGTVYSDWFVVLQGRSRS